MRMRLCRLQNNFRRQVVRNLSKRGDRTHNYWAMRCGDCYDLARMPLEERPKIEEWQSIEGPFSSLYKARRRVQIWIREDMDELRYQLKTINSLRLHHFRGAK